VDDGGLSLRFVAKRNPNYYPSWSKLYEATSQGKTALRGKPAIGLHTFEFDPAISPDASPLRYEKLGELEEIPAEKLRAAGEFAFFNIERYGFLNDGILYTTIVFPQKAWAYTDIEVNFLQLMRWFHPAEGKSLRVGTEVNLIEPEAPRAETSAEAPQAKSSAKAAGTRNVGRRPRIWDRDGAINGSRGAIYDGKLVRTPEAAAILGLSASTLEKLRLIPSGMGFDSWGIPNRRLI
jgi:hypothetical protein